MNARFKPSGRLRGEITAPPDKSISHRAVLLAAMHDEPVRVTNYLHAADTTSTLEALRALGALVGVHGNDVVVRGSGLREAREAEGPIDVGNAGTLMRMLPGWLASQAGRTYTLDGDASIRRRPVDRVAEPLERMGARITATDGRYPPLTVHGARLHSIAYDLPVASAQVKSCVLLAGLAADGDTTVAEPAPSRDHTERMLLGAGVDVRREGLRVSLERADGLELPDTVVPGDPSSAAFLVAAACCIPRSRIVLCDVSLNWTRTGFLRIAERMGAVILGELEPVPAASDGARAEIPGEEPVGELDVAAAPLEGTVVKGEEAPLAIDELPLVALLGCFAEGETVVQGAEELRHKEADRIAGVVEGLRGLGAEIEATAAGFAVRGGGGLAGGTIDARGDHRLAMLGAIAGLASREGVEVVGMEAASVSYPEFERDLATLLGGARVSPRRAR